MAIPVRKWTPAQTAAIDTRDRTMLLSAAAGSGKTAVLTERVIRSLTEGEHPLELSRILAVTFTRSSAAELRVRIGATLSAAIEKDPENQHLARQLRLLPGANISTIDSFCIGILRRFATSCGISPAFRIADEQEAKLLRASLMEELIQDGYAGTIPQVDNPAFCSLVSHITQTREERYLGEILLVLLEKLDSFEGGVETLYSYAEDLLKEADLPLAETTWWKMLAEETSALCHHYVTLLSADINELLHDPLTDDKLLTNLEACRDQFATIAQTVVHGSDIPFDFPTMRASTKHEKTPLEEATIDHIKEGKDKLRGLKTHFFSLGQSYWSTTMKTLAEGITTLAHVCCEFQKRYEKECHRRSAYDFSTISRFTYRLLLHDGQPTEEALTLRGELDAVYVDEYQDVNPIQHAIFEAISPETGRFLVGDIKQSIYGFRQADPTIFAALRATFPPLDTTTYTTTASHFMSQNFRSDKCVVDFVNVVFDFLFGNAGQSIHYCYDDRLDCAKDQSGVTYSPVPVVVCFDSNKEIKKRSQDASLPPASEVFDGSDIPDTTPEDMEEAEGLFMHREAMWVANQIHLLLTEGKRSDGVTPIEPGDIAILFRSVQTRYKPYVEALSLYGIPCKKPQDADFFASPEVLLALALLNTIENPRRDIYLTAVLCSPLYRFTADELTLIRHDTPEGIPLYEALCLWCEDHNDFAKGHFFLSQLDSFRRVAEAVPMDKLLCRLFEETPLMAIAGAETPEGENNLKLLYNYARTYQGAAFSGLYSFIRFIDKQIETGATFTPHSVSEASNAITLSTIHSSKGLEYPVVFLVECGSHLNNRDAQASIICDKSTGLSFFLRDPTGLVRSPHPVHGLLQRVLIKHTFEEELRLLYVALTRAKERLFITGTAKKTTTLESVMKCAQDAATAPSAYAVENLHSYMAMILASITASTDTDKWQLLLDPEVEMVDGDIAPDLSRLDTALIAEREKTFRDRLAYVYPWTYLAALPKKLSVSKLYPGILDDTIEETAQYPVVQDAPVKEVVVLPVTDEAEPDRAEKWRRLPEAYAGAMPPDPTDKGIATHLFMQFCDFEVLLRDGVEVETARLVEKGYLDQRLISLMRPEEIQKFRESSLIRTMCDAKRIWREFRFNIKLPAHLFADDPEIKEQLQGETLFVQGVMDALIETQNGSLVLVDYKTDRLTREEMRNPLLAAKKLRARHKTQLTYYAEAVKAIFGKAPSRILIYALQLGDTVEI